MSGILEATPYVKISNNNGFSFGDFMVLDTGIIGEAVVGSEDSISQTFSNPQAIDIRRGRERALDVYNTGSASVTVQDSSVWNPLAVTSLWAGKIVPGIQMKVWAEFPSTILSCTGSGGISTPYTATRFVPIEVAGNLDIRLAFVVTDGLDGQQRSLARVADTVSTFGWTAWINYGTLNLDLSIDGSVVYTFTSTQLPQVEVGTSVALRFCLDGQTGRVSFYYWLTAPVVAFDDVTSDVSWILLSTDEDSAFFTAFAANTYRLYQSISDLKIASALTYGNFKFNLLAFCLRTTTGAGVATTLSSFDMCDGLKSPGMSSFFDKQSLLWTVSGSTVASVNYVYPLFAGYISSFNYDWTKGVVGQNTVTFNAEDAFRPLNMVEIETVTGTATNDLPGARINQILNTITYPTSGLSISTGSTPLQDDANEVRTVLPLLQAVAEADLGSFYADATGFVRFDSRDVNARRHQSTPIAFDDVVGNGYAYQAFSVSYDDDLISNEVSIDNGGDVQQASDQTSITKYFRRSMSKTGLLMENDADALSMAQTILASRKDPTVRVTNIGLDITKRQATDTVKYFRQVPSVLSTEFGRPLALQKNWYQTDPAGIGFDVTTFSSSLVVEGISHTIRPDRWIIELSTSEPIVTQFILDDSEYGAFGDALSY